MKRRKEWGLGFNLYLGLWEELIMKKSYLSFGLLLILFVVFGYDNAFAAPAKWPQQILVGTFPKGSESYPVNVALAQLISKHTPATGVIREFIGGVPGITALGKGEIHTWGIGQNDEMQAYYGKAPYKQPIDLKLLCYYFPGTLGIGVRPNEGINKVEDLAGKRVIYKFPPIKFLTDLNTSILQHYRILDKVKPMSETDSQGIVVRMIDKTVDCFMTGVGGGSTLEIRDSVGLKWLPLSKEAAEYATSTVPGTMPHFFPKWALQRAGLPLDTKFLSYSYCFGIVVPAGIDEDVAYGILDAIYGDDHLKEVADLSPFIEDVSINRASSAFWLPFHPGAVKYYKERKVWTSEKEARQKELLALPRGN